MSGIHYFTFHPADWLGNDNIRKLSLHDRGVYIDLLCTMYQADMLLSNDDEHIAYMLRMSLDDWLVSKNKLMNCKPPLITIDANNRLTNIDLQKKHEHALSISEARKAAALAKAEKEAQKKLKKHEK